MVGTQTKAEGYDALLSRLAASRTLTDNFFDVVRREALYDRPIPERHRIVFYIGHLEAFDWNLLRGRAFDADSFHPEFDQLFAFGIDPVGGGLPTDQRSDWPSLTEIHQYNARVRQQLDARLKSSKPPAPSNGSPAPLSTLLDVAIEHRLMHAETLAYMLNQLPSDRKIFRESREVAAAPLTERRTLEIPAGETTLGMARRSGRFGWDNEFEAHAVTVPAFAVDEYKVTNGDFLRFVRAGGYRERSLWDEDAWRWIEAQGIRHPAFWIDRGGSWFYRGMFGETPLPSDWPVYVSHAEASAYARWVGKSLPTEAQWHRAAYGTPGHLESGPDAADREYPWGSKAPGAELGNFDFRRWDPAPVNAYPGGRSAFGVAGMLGNGWEWTSTVFAPFPGFEPFSFYPGYSANFFDGTHYVMKGASARTAACMLRRSFRNWFQGHYPYVYASFRCVMN
jgi:ergothioneine biosynthesis protein EgtB